MRIRNFAVAALLASTCAITAAPAAHAQSTPARQATFDIPAGDLASALRRFSRQARVEVIFSASELRGRRTAGVKGTFSPQEALDRIVSSSGTELVRDPSGAYLVRVSGNGGSQSTQSTSSLGDGGGENSDIVVTGTNIKGVAPVGSDLRTISRKEIDKSGQATVQDVLRLLPQNFNGGPAENTQLTGGNEALLNATRATGVNLRGLGAGSTLVLVNGRRLVAGGSQGRFAEVSGIPLGAVERIEVLPDGASAIYGSDAVGGVVNIVLRRDYSGVDVSARYGLATRGGGNDAQISGTLGTKWATGSALLSLEFYRRGNVAASDRRLSASSDLRPLGGSNFDTRFDNPGTIVIGSRTYAIPSNQNGVGLTASDFTVGTINYHNRAEGTDILPDTKRWSGFLSLRQEIGSDIELFADLLGSQRRVFSRTGSVDTTLTVPRTNAFYVNPEGGTGSLTVNYSLIDDYGPQYSTSKVDTGLATVGATYNFARKWSATAYASYSEQLEHITGGPYLNSTRLSAALADSNPATAFNPFCDAAAFQCTNQATLDAIVQQSHLRRLSRSFQASTVINGSLITLPGGDLKIALGGDLRTEHLSTSLSLPPTAQLFTKGRTVKAAYAEAVIPIFGEGNAVPGLNRLELSVAGRYEHYSDFGSARTPKIGLAWSPVAPLTFRGSWSRSFKAPNLIDLDETNNFALIFPLSDRLSSTGTSNALVFGGTGNADLKQQTANTWTGGIDFNGKSFGVPSIHLTYFRTDFNNRIEAVSYDYQLGTPQNSFLEIRNFTAAQRQAACRYIFLTGPQDACLTQPVDVLVDIRLRNVSQVKTDGLDFRVEQEFGVASGMLRLTVDGTYLFSFKRASTPTSSLTSLLNQTNNPLRLRGRGSVGWSNNTWDVTGFINYANPYDDLVSVPARRVKSYTTLDLHLGYKVAASGGPANGVSVGLDVQNLFDRDPPFVNNPAGVGYDQSNGGDLRGRVVSLAIRKTW